MSTRNVRRRLEPFLANPSCAANACAVVLDVPMAAVAESEGHFEREAQSPYALRRGALFERALFADGARELRAALARSGVLASEDAVVIDLRLTRNQGPHAKTLDQARASFAWWLAQSSEHERKTHLFIAPAMTGPAPEVLGDGILAPDIVIAHPVDRGATRWALEIGEIKVYPDRGGYTDTTDLGATRAQAGLYLLALRAALGPVAPVVTVNRMGFLVLSWAGTNRPSVRPAEDLEFRARAAERSIERLRAIAGGVPRVAHDVRRALAVISAAPTEYREQCLSFCARAALCQRTACEQSDPRALGDAASRALSGVTINRARAVIDGASAPANEREAALARRFASIARLVS